MRKMVSSIQSLKSKLLTTFIRCYTITRFVGFPALLSTFLIGCESYKFEYEDTCLFDGYYYDNNEKKWLEELSSDFILISIDSSTTDDDIVYFVNSQGIFKGISASDVIRYPNYRFKHVVAKFLVGNDCYGITYVINEIETNGFVDYVHYTIQTDDCTNLIGEQIGNKCVDSYSDLFYVKVNNPNDLTDLDKIVQKTNTEKLEQNTFLKDWFTLRANKASKGDALQMANYFYETGLFKIAEPNIIKLVVDSLLTTNIDTCSYEGFYYYQDEKLWLEEISNDYVLIGIYSVTSDEDIENFINAQGIFEEISVSDVIKYQYYDYKHVVAKFLTSLNCTEITSIINNLEKNEIVDYAHYTIRTDDCRNDIWEPIGNKCVDSYESRFTVSVKDPNDLTDLYNIVHKTNTEILSQNQFMANFFVLRADKNSMGDALQMSNYFYETGLFDAAAPGIIKLVVEKLDNGL